MFLDPIKICNFGSFVQEKNHLPIKAAFDPATSTC